MSALPHQIAGTGLFALDVVVRTDGTLSPPTLGGSAGNVLSILGGFGWRPVPIGAMGDDGAARVLCDEFEGVGADLSLFRRSRHRCTPIVYQHQLDAGADRTHRFTFVCPACGGRRKPRWDGDEALFDAEEHLPRASVFFLDRASPLGVQLAQRYADLGAVVVFEPSSVDDTDLFQRALKASHIVKYADERMTHLSFSEAAGPLVEIQTRGHQGLRFRAPSLANEWFSMSAYSLPYIRDTSGAGDWCTAGLIYKLFSLGGVSRMTDYTALTQALAFGQALSSLNCLTEGARGLMKVWSAQKILKVARELCGRRIRAERARQFQDAEHVDEPRLVQLASERRLREGHKAVSSRIEYCVQH